MSAQLQIRYQAEGLPRGITVAEWEVYEGLPMYSVYPEAQNAKRPSDRGFFMYREATDEERVAMNVSRGRRRSTKTPEERKEARRKYLREWNIANRRLKDRPTARTGPFSVIDLEFRLEEIA